MGLILGYNNVLETASVTVTPSDEDVTSSGRLYDRRPSEVYRWSHTAAADPALTIAATFASETLRVAGLINTDLPDGASVTFTIGSTSQTATVETADDGRRHVSVDLGNVTASSASITVDNDPDSIPAGDYNIGQAFIGAGYEPPRAWRRSLESGYVDPSQPGETVSGDVVDYPARAYRQVTLNAVPLQTVGQQQTWRRVRYAVTGGRRVLVHQDDHPALFGFVTGFRAMTPTADGEEAGVTVREVV